MMGATAWTGASLSTILSAGADNLVHCWAHGEDKLATLSGSQADNTSRCQRPLSAASKLLQMREGATQAATSSDMRHWAVSLPPPWI